VPRGRSAAIDQGSAGDHDVEHGGLLGAQSG
jgi:hypothetical protein